MIPKGRLLYKPSLDSGNLKKLFQAPALTQAPVESPMAYIKFVCRHWGMSDVLLGTSRPLMVGHKALSTNSNELA